MPSPDRAPEGFHCSACGTWHDELPLAFHLRAPDVWSPAMEGAEGCELTGETCVIHGQHFFVRGLIRLPVLGQEEHFEWGVWVSLSEESFRRALDAWETPGREHGPAAFGWLCNELADYAEPTTNLRTMVHTQPVGLRPLIEVEPTEHPLAVEQRTGLTRDAVVARAGRLLHAG